MKKRFFLAGALLSSVAAARELSLGMSFWNDHMKQDIHGWSLLVHAFDSVELSFGAGANDSWGYLPFPGPLLASGNIENNSAAQLFTRTALKVMPFRDNGLWSRAWFSLLSERGNGNNQGDGFLCASRVGQFQFFGYNIGYRQPLFASDKFLFDFGIGAMTGSQRQFRSAKFNGASGDGRTWKDCATQRVTFKTQGMLSGELVWFLSK